VKSDARNPKSERSPKSEIRSRIRKTLRVLNFRTSGFGFLSDFGFRISELLVPRLALAVGAVLTLAGCSGLWTEGEKAARKDFQTVTDLYRTNHQRPDLPVLTADCGLSNFLRFAILNRPQVEAAYYDWMASIERITVDRSLPDPQFTFQTFNASTLVSSVMPGLLMQFPGPTKLGARADVSAAESRGKYFAFETEVLRAAFEVKTSCYSLKELDQKIRIDNETLRLLANLESLARSQNEVGKATLQDVLRAQIEHDRLNTDLANLEASRASLLARFKAALGLRAAQPEPPVPTQIESTPLDLDPGQLLTTAFAQNPKLKAMESDVHMAEAGIRVARKDRIPDFSAGLSADLKAEPVMWNPQFSMTLPIWRDKLAAEVAAAQAAKSAAESRLTAEQIQTAVDLAEKVYMADEAGRNLALLREQLLPKAQQSLALAQAGYPSGTIDFFNLIDAQRTLLGFELEEVSATTQRETALAELSLLIAGVPPPGAPVLAAGSAVAGTLSSNPGKP